jgi:hypothetical protein
MCSGSASSVAVEKRCAASTRWLLSRRSRPARRMSVLSMKVMTAPRRWWRSSS